MNFKLLLSRYFSTAFVNNLDPISKSLDIVDPTVDIVYKSFDIVDQNLIQLRKFVNFKSP